MNGEAARRYKEISGLNTEAVDRMREHDRELVSEQLEKRLADAERALSVISEQERVAKVGVNSHWEAAMDALYEERWLAMRPMPAPASPAPRMTTIQCDNEVAETYARLQEALRKPSMLGRRPKQERD